MSQVKPQIETSSKRYKSNKKACYSSEPNTYLTPWWGYRKFASTALTPFLLPILQAAAAVDTTMDLLFSADH